MCLAVIATVTAVVARLTRSIIWGVAAGVATTFVAFAVWWILVFVVAGPDAYS
jgi:hypothetical protein